MGWLASIRHMAVSIVTSTPVRPMPALNTQSTRSTWGINLGRGDIQSYVGYRVKGVFHEFCVDSAYRNLNKQVNSDPIEHNLRRYLYLKMVFHIIQFIEFSLLKYLCFQFPILAKCYSHDMTIKWIHNTTDMYFHFRCYSSYFYYYWEKPL